jgi:large subunit ribosomal protein L32
MGVPKRKTSKARIRSRKAANAWRAPNIQIDKKTGEVVLSHIVNPKTGQYKGRQVLSITAEE